MARSFLEFMFPEFYSDDDREKAEREARARGKLYSAEDLTRIMTIWGGLIEGEPEHTADNLRLSLKTGGSITMHPDRLSLDVEKADAETMRAAIMHIQEMWGGSAVILARPDAPMTVMERLKVRAYAEVYGVALRDEYDLITPLTATDLATLPSLRAAIRAQHRDAPPERQDGRPAARTGLPIPEAA